MYGEGGAGRDFGSPTFDLRTDNPGASRDFGSPTSFSVWQKGNEGAALPDTDGIERLRRTEEAVRLTILVSSAVLVCLPCVFLNYPSSRDSKHTDTTMFETPNPKLKIPIIRPRELYYSKAHGPRSIPSQFLN